jgi:hypothetical protein
VVRVAGEVAGEDEPWPAMAVDIVRKTKEIKRGDIIALAFSLPGRHGVMLKDHQQKSVSRQLWSEYLLVS